MSLPPPSSSPDHATPVRIGTSGYSYKDWVGPFYPEGTKPEEYLSFYARHFGAVEINYTYYRMPAARTLESMADKSEGNVEFVLKLHGDMTHKRSAGTNDYRDFLSACRPLADRGLLGALLAQFPYSFHATETNANYLKKMREHLPDQNVVVELRNAKWIRQDTFSLLRELDFGFCCVDAPQIRGLPPPVAVGTSRTGYVRFHGRNRAQWYEHERPEQRYDYRYDRRELAEWVPKIRSLMDITHKVYCFTNNHFQSKAVESAQILLDLLQP